MGHKTAIGRRVLRWCILFLFFIAPLKMGNPIGGGEVANFPMDIWQWLFMAWPPYILGGASALLCLAVLVAYPPKSVSTLAGSVALCWIGLVLAAAIGLVRTTEWDYATLFFCHLVGVASLVVAVCLIISQEPAFGKALASVIVVGTILSWGSGWHQRFGGLEQTKQFAEERARREGVALNAAIKGRLEQNRSFGAFVNPNSYGAHLVLTGPLALLLLWRWGRRLEPVRVSQPLFICLGCMGFLGALWFSGSRGAMVAFGAGIAVAVAGQPFLKRWRWVLAAAGLLAGMIAVWLLSRDRSLLSVSARAQYYLAAWRMFLAHPVTGVGLGEFFPYYLRLKPIGAEETRIAHSMVLCFLSQAGFLGGLAASVCLGVPALFAVLPVRMRNQDPWLFSACVCGISAWSIHSLIDFNVQIPGTLSTAAAMMLLLPEGRQMWRPGTRFSRAFSVFLTLLCILGLCSFARIPGELAYQRISDQTPRLSFRVLRKHFERVSRLLPMSPYPVWYYAKVCLHRGMAVQALEAVKRATELSPHRSAFWHRLAEVSIVLGEYVQAERAIAVAEEWYPGNGSVIATKALLTVIEDVAENGGEKDRMLVVESVGRRRARMLDTNGSVTVVLEETPQSIDMFLMPISEMCDLLNKASLSWGLDSARTIRFVPGES